MNKNYVGIFLLACILGLTSEAMASTLGQKEIECSYTNITNSVRNISGVCQVDYGVTGVNGQAFRNVTWPDEVVTQILISENKTSGGGTSAEIDGFPSEASLSCGYEIYRIRNNILELRGDLCR